MEQSGRKHKFKKPDFNPGGEKGKLHRELGIPEDQKIPQARLDAAIRSHDPEIRRDAIRARTLEGFHHGGHKAGGHPHAERRYRNMR